MEQRIKVYSTYPDDLYLRRKLQNDIQITNTQAQEAAEYALFYLNHRLKGNTSHTFLPLKGELMPFTKTLAMPKEGKEKTWTYFSSSPAELACIQHAINESNKRIEFSTTKNGTAQNEEEAVRILAEIAKTNGAILAIRLHPRLRRKIGAKSESSALRSLMKASEYAREIHPTSVKVIGPDELVNSYILCIISDQIISFRGTIPVEANLMGISPIVLAVNKGFANYWIRSHALRAPKTYAELEMLLENPEESVECLIKFLIEFWYINRMGELSLCDKESWQKFEQIVENPKRYYTNEINELKREGKILSEDEIRSMIDEYIKNCKNIIEKIFFERG